MSVQTQSLIEYFATKAGIAPDKYFEALRSVPFVNCPNITREEMTGVLLLAKKLDLDPFSKEIYAIPGRNDGPVVPVIAFDGWMKILLRQPTFDGMETLPSDEMIEVDGYPRKVHAWCECVIYDKERSHPIRVREYFEEVMRPRYFRTNKGSVMLDQNSPWVRMPWRMLRAKTVIQAVRNAYPVGGFEVMSEDEVEEATAEAVAATPAPTTSSSVTKKERMQAKVTRPGYATIADKAALHELLERLISHVHQKGKSVKAAHGWIIKNIALDSQPYAIDWVTLTALPLKRRHLSPFLIRRPRRNLSLLKHRKRSLLRAYSMTRPTRIHTISKASATTSTSMPCRNAAFFKCPLPGRCPLRHLPLERNAENFHAICRTRSKNRCLV